MVDYQKRANLTEKCYKTQKEMANSLGVSPRTIRRWKKGKFKPSSKNRGKLNRRYNYYKKKYGAYRETDVEITKEDGTKKTLKNRSELSDFDAFDQILQEQNEFLERFKDSLKSYPDIEEVEISKFKIKITKFGGKK